MVNELHLLSLGAAQLDCPSIHAQTRGGRLVMYCTALYLLEREVRRLRERAQTHGGDDTCAPAPSEPATEKDKEILREWHQDHEHNGLGAFVIRAARAEQDEHGDDEGKPKLVMGPTIFSKDVIVTDRRNLRSWLMINPNTLVDTEEWR